MIYQIGTPSAGPISGTFEAASDEAAKAIAKAQYGETVLDIMDWTGERGEDIALLVVAD